MTFERVRASMRRNPHVADLALTAAVVLVALLTTLALVVPNAVVPPPPTPVIVIWAVLLAAPLALRRRIPVAVVVVTGIHFPLYWAVGQINEIGAWLVLGVAIYSAALYGRRPLARRVVIALACAIAAVSGGVLVATGTATPLEAFAITMFNLVPFAVAWPLGVMMRSLRETRTALEERNRQLAEERETNARRAIVEERVRIARELHDVVAHHVSVIGIQAGVARRLFDRRPQQAAEAIASVETTSRQAIIDLHQIVGFLRRHDDRDEGLAPQPDLARLPGMIAQMRAAGLPVEYVVEGSAQRWSAAVELSAFRIVQEALTNVLKHAGPAKTTVRLCHEAGGLDIEVLDDGHRGPIGNGGPGGNRAGVGGNGAGGAPVGGKGLTGMRERAALHGGELEAGPRDGHGFRVHVRLHESTT
jgi:signal transduction histidine kinase